MNSKIRWYVISVVVAAALVGWRLYLHAPGVDNATITNLILLSVLALGGEALSILLPRSATGSMAFIPYFALAFVVPAWPSVLAVAIVRVIAELYSRRPPIKATFNIAAHSLMEGVAISLYLTFGGKGFAAVAASARLSELTAKLGLQTLGACVVALYLNNLLVAGAIALSSDRSVRRVWLDNSRGTVGADLLSLPLVFLFAWVYAGFGMIAAASLWIPMLGLRQLQRTNLELEKINQELLELMVKSLEARDPYTSGHSRRVHHYSVLVARVLGLSERETELIGRAALLHDVGKIHEKYASVLAKTDKLTQEEWALIQEHSADGANLVSTMSHLRDVVPAIRGHHENWDGTGYPDGSAGEMIPLAARIIRFADTIDAMTTQRPYRTPLNEHQVRAELVRCRGTQFDPQITDRLLSSPLWPALFAPSNDVEPVKTKFSIVAGASGQHARSVRRA